MLPVSACIAMPQRFGDVPVAASDVFTSTVLPLYEYAHVAFSDSGVLPSSMFSIEPDVSSRMRTFGSGGLTSIVCARALYANDRRLPKMGAATRLRLSFIGTPYA